MKDNFIGQRIAQYYKWHNSNGFISPTLELEKIMKEISDDLGRYINNNPNAKQAYIDKQRALIDRIYSITESLQAVEPLDVWSKINEDIRRTTALGDGDYMKILIPLKPEIPKPDLYKGENPKQIVLDYVWPGQLTNIDYSLI